MFACGKSLWCKRMSVWQALFCLTVLAFLCRAVIPVGYMPDLSGKRDTTFAITLCVGGNLAVMQMGFSDDAGNASEDHGFSGPDCPFGINASHKLLAGLNTLALAGLPIVFQTAAPAARNQALPPMPALGPPLGSRAPPFNLG